MTTLRNVAAHHDKEAFLANLRDHLSRHDRPLAFLFGAGTSCSVRVDGGASAQSTKPLIPDVHTLTMECRDAATTQGSEYASAWSAIADRCNSQTTDPNVEHILSMLHMMINAIAPSEQLAGLDYNKLVNLNTLIRRHIAEVVNPSPTDIPRDMPHHGLARWLAKTARNRPVEVFTVNYDILFELAFEAERLPFFDGFIGSHEPFFYPDSLVHPRLTPAPGWTRLWKIHGSVNWHRRKSDKRIVRVQRQPSGEMIFPTFEKYDKSRQQPYVTYIDQLDRFLSLDNALLVIAGFGFGDEHLNDIILRRLENNPGAHVYALMYVEPDKPFTSLYKYAERRGNVVVVAPDTGIIDKKHGAWLSNDARCKMSIVDFSALCRFLDRMTSE